MKKIYYLLLLMLCAHAGYAANCIATTRVSVNYKTQQVTFKLTWTGCNGTTHLNKVWCFVDFQTVDAAGNKGAWKRATVSGAATVTNGTYAAGNTTGFYVTGSNGQSATVTVKLGNASGKFNWCAFATDYPPNAIMTNGSYILKGTPPFTLNGTATVSQKKYNGNRITTITDATNNPGGFIIDYIDYAGCSTNTINLGSVGFTSTQTWVVGAQTWSAPVTATYCNKTAYSSPTSAPYGTDCRNNTNGHLFSWCMVKRYAAQLCPSPWRVPTTTDFCTLDKNLNSRSDCNNRTHYSTTEYNRYFGAQWNATGVQWALSYGDVTGGSCVYSCSINWANDEYNSAYGYALFIGGGGADTGSIRPLYYHDKYIGIELRCVR